MFSKGYFLSAVKSWDCVELISDDIICPGIGEKYPHNVG